RGRVERATQRFAIDGDYFPSNCRGQRVEPLLNASHQRGRIEPRENPAKRIVRRNAIGQFEECAEKVEFGFAETLDVSPAVRVPQRGADGKDDDVEQGMAPSPFHARVGKTFKERCKKFQGVTCRHPSPPGLSSELRRILRGTLDEVNCSRE